MLSPEKLKDMEELYLFLENMQMWPEKWKDICSTKYSTDKTKK
jgi:hypothetical protein